MLRTTRQQKLKSRSGAPRKGLNYNRISSIGHKNSSKILSASRQPEIKLQRVISVNSNSSINGNTHENMVVYHKFKGRELEGDQPQPTQRQLRGWAKWKNLFPCRKVRQKTSCEMQQTREKEKEVVFENQLLCSTMWADRKKGGPKLQRYCTSMQEDTGCEPPSIQVAGLKAPRMETTDHFRLRTTTAENYQRWRSLKTQLQMFRA